MTGPRRCFVVAWMLTAAACSGGSSSGLVALPTAPSPVPVSVSCDRPPVAIPVPPSGTRLEPGQMVTVSEASSLALATGPLRLTFDGEGEFALRSSVPPEDSMSSQLRAGSTRIVFWQGPAVLSLMPSAGHTLGVAVCTP